MILPSKHLPPERALLTIGAFLVQRLAEPRTVSSLWEECVHRAEGKYDGEVMRPLGYDTFVLALDLLFTMRAIEMHDGVLVRMKP